MSEHLVKRPLHEAVYCDKVEVTASFSESFMASLVEESRPKDSVQNACCWVGKGRISKSGKNCKISMLVFTSGQSDQGYRSFSKRARVCMRIAAL